MFLGFGFGLEILTILKATSELVSYQLFIISIVEVDMTDILLHVDRSSITMNNKLV
jgi:hypothetical protein